MSDNQSNNSQPAEAFGNVRNDAEDFRTLPKDAALFGNLPKAAEPFRTVRNDTATFRQDPPPAERDESHSLTVKEVARTFEAAGVARTERSIVNWCQPNRTGIARLDAYFDPNERRYYISPQSVELAIAEEKAKAARINEAEAFGTIPHGAEAFRTLQYPPEKSSRPFLPDTEKREHWGLENELRDLQITNKAKDMVIEQLQRERSGFFDQLLVANHKLGELENKVLQLEGPQGQNYNSSN